MRYDVLIWGAGRIGYAATYDLVNKGLRIIVADISKTSLEKISKLGVDTVKVGINYNWLDDYRDKVKLITSSLPGPISFKCMKLSIKKGFSVVDATSLGGEDPRKLNAILNENNSFAVLYAGVAPGMVQVLSGALYRILGGLDKLDIFCGGIPQDPEDKPLRTNITWSPIGYLGMYARKSRKVVDGKTILVDPLEDIGSIVFPGEGEYEYFLSDGLRSLLFNFEDVPNMSEYSIRWKGHINDVKLIRELGLLSREHIEIGGCEITPIEVMAKLISEKLTIDIKDKVLTMVIGQKNGNYGKYINVEYYDEKTGLTAMQRTTGFNLSRFTLMALDEKLVRKVGVNYPEEFGLNEELFNEYLRSMGEVGITINFETGTDFN